MHNDTLHDKLSTSDSIDDFTRDGDMSAIKGTGAFKYYFRVDERMGIKTCSHLKGNKKEVNA